MFGFCWPIWALVAGSYLPAPGRQWKAPQRRRDAPEFAPQEYGQCVPYVGFPG